MNRLRTAITDYLRRSTGWVFLTVILVASWALTQMADKTSVGDMLRFIGSLSMAVAPILAYGFLREEMAPRRRKWSALLTLIVFGGGLIVFGVTVQDLPFTRYLLLSESLANRHAIKVLVLTLLLCEGMNWWKDYREQKGPLEAWLPQLRPEWVAAILILLLSVGIVLSSNDVQVAAANGSRSPFWYLGLIGQTFVVYYPYYFLYYVHHHLLFRKVRLEKGLFHYFIGLLALLLLFTVLHTAFASLVPAMTDYRLHIVSLTEGIVSDLNFEPGLTVILLSLPYIITAEWYRKERAITRLEAEKSATELRLLKEQINPHFFFNTLNNLYAMSLTREARTPETILQLSELMRYVIYRGKEAGVPLREEIKYLQDYLDLQSIRLQKQLDLRFTTDVDDPNRSVPPLLFVLLLENAFKHGVEPAEEDCFLHLSLTANERGITFRCQNSYEPGQEAERVGGLGLANLRRRLELLFPDAYTLELWGEEGVYTANLYLRD